MLLAHKTRLSKSPDKSNRSLYSLFNYLSFPLFFWSEATYLREIWLCKVQIVFNSRTEGKVSCNTAQTLNSCTALIMTICTNGSSFQNGRFFVLFTGLLALRAPRSHHLRSEISYSSSSLLGHQLSYYIALPKAFTRYASPRLICPFLK